MAAPERFVESLGGVRFHRRFHVRLALIYGATLLAILIAMAVVTYQLGVRSEVDGLKQRLLAIATSLGQGLNGDELCSIPLDSPIMTPLHATLLSQFGRVANGDPDIDSIYLLRPTSEPDKLRFLVDYVKRGAYGEPGELYDAAAVPTLMKSLAGALVEDEPVLDVYGLSLSGYAPVRDSTGSTVAIIGVDVFVNRLLILKQRVLLVTAAVFGVAILLMIAVSLFVARAIRRPLNAMVRATAAIAAGDLTTRLALQRSDEFGVLGRCFDSMAQDLGDRQLIRDIFGRYVSEDVAKILLKSGHAPVLGGEERVVTILFSDLRNYSTISERLAPVQIVNMLNRYLGEMNTIIDHHHGCVIEFLGDGILAVFGAPVYCADHAEQAVRCAIAMRERLVVLNTEWQEDGLAELWQQAGIAKLEARVGIHTGFVIAGNLGSTTRMKYAVIGDSVNVAARLEVFNKELGTSILLSDEVRTCLSSELLTNTTDHGCRKVKGRGQAVRLYSI